MACPPDRGPLLGQLPADLTLPEIAYPPDRDRLLSQLPAVYFPRICESITYSEAKALRATSSVVRCVVNKWRSRWDVEMERDLLLSIVSSSNGGWQRLALWGSEEPVSEWEGVTTNAKGLVCELRLPRKSLQGEVHCFEDRLSPSMADMTACA